MSKQLTPQQQHIWGQAVLFSHSVMFLAGFLGGMVAALMETEGSFGLSVAIGISAGCVAALINGLTPLVRYTATPMYNLLCGWKGVRQ